MSPEKLCRLNGGTDRAWKPIHSPKYAYDATYGFEAQSLNVCMENLIKEENEWQQLQPDRFLGETAMVRGSWEYEDNVEG